MALAVLKPTPAQLERGLKLHADSLVFESYGFMTRSSLDGDLLKAAVEAGASDIEFEDLAEAHSSKRRRRRLRPMCLIKRLARFTHATHFLRDHVAQAVAPADVRAAKSAARHAIYLTTNGVPVTGEWISVENELRYVSVFFQLGVRMMHLTYNRRNMLGDGCGEPGNAGLSDFGRAAITKMNRLGVIVGRGALRLAH